MNLVFSNIRSTYQFQIQNSISKLWVSSGIKRPSTTRYTRPSYNRLVRGFQITLWSHEPLHKRTNELVGGLGYVAQTLQPEEIAELVDILGGEPVIELAQLIDTLGEPGLAEILLDDPDQDGSGGCHDTGALRCSVRESPR